MRRSLLLTPKVTLTFVLFAAVLLASVGLLAYHSGRESLEAVTFSDLLSTAIQKEAAFETWIMEGLSHVTSIANSPFLQEQIAILRTVSDSEIAETAHDKIVAELLAVLGQGHSFISLTILEPDSGKVIVATNSSQEGTFKEDRLYFINGQVESYVQNVYFSLECQCPSMVAAAPIHSPDGELLAVVAGRLNLDEMGAIINLGTGLRESIDAYLVNTTSFLVTQPQLLRDPAILQRGVRTAAVEQCLRGTNGTVVADDYRGIPAMSVYRWLSARALCLVVEIDHSEALQPIQSFGRGLLAVSLVALLIASLVAAALARTITRPVLALKDGVTRFGAGDFDVRLPQKSNDELGTLVYEFNSMADAIVEKETLLQNYARTLEQRVNERTAQLTFLAEASRKLSESFDYSERLREVAQLAVPQIADWCSVDIINDDGKLERLSVVHLDPRKIELAYELHRLYSSDVQSATYRVLESGQPEFIPEFTDEMLFENVSGEEVYQILRELGLKSSIVVPLLAHGHIFGVLTLAMAESERFYDRSDLELAEDLARRAGLLIDNAKLYQETQQMNTELESRVAERTAQLTAANYELEAFSYSVSHDLRAPLRALDGFSQALEEDYADTLDDVGKSYLARIRSSSQRMGRLIDDLLELSRLSRSEMRNENVDLTKLAGRIAEELRFEYPGHEVQFEAKEGLVASGDINLLQIVLYNLLNNAWKYTTKQPSPKVEFGETERDWQTVYYVRDNGAGFDMAYADKLFGVFQRLHSVNEFPGNGIGLATVQRIVHRHGGQVWAEAEINKGATFYFSLVHK